MPSNERSPRARARPFVTEMVQLVVTPAPLLWGAPSAALHRLASLCAARAMDFHGQKLAEDAYQVIILAFSVISFIAGYSQR